MTRLRPILTLCFALIFLLSGLGNGYGRAMMAGARQVRICGEVGYNSVTLGVNGEKLPRLHDCASCCIAVGVMHAPQPQPGRSRRAEPTPWRGMVPARAPRGGERAVWPRGPPVKA